MSRPDVLPFCVSLRRRGWAPRSRGDCPAVCRQGQARRRVDLCAAPAAQPPGGTAHGQAGKGTLVLAPSAGSTAETTVMARMKGRHMRLWMRTLALTAGIAALAIGRAHVCTPVTNAHLVCRLLLEKKNKHTTHTTLLHS